ncbi:hypothetical protein BLD25_01065 [Candidatus Gracilibacteria bacterium GN02-872]|nr:hypothetical protein BLD25_01065 [Candidatus Gracilibacteria bacterium GN02-872]
MGDYLICSLKNSKIFESYLLYSYQLFYTGISNLDLTIAIFTGHSFVSLRFAYFLDLLDGKNFVYNIFIEIIILLLTGIIIDLILYFLGKYLGKYLKFKYESKKLFYIFLRFVPIIGIFGTFIGALLSKEFDYKKDFLKIFIGNLLFIIFNITFWLVLTHFCGFYDNLT